MQISTPTQSISSNDNLRESSTAGPGGLHSGSDSPAIWGANNKKGKLGIFARLLEGLISKTKTGATEPNSGKAETLELSGPGKAGKNNLKNINTKNELNLINNAESEAAELHSGAAGVFLRQGLKAEARSLAAQAQKARSGLGDLNSGLKKDELSLTQDYSGLNQNRKEGAVLAGRADESRSTAQDMRGKSGFNRGETAPWLNGRDRAGNSGNADLINASLRDTDAKLTQALAAQLKNAAGDRENNKLSRTAKSRSNLEIRDLRTGSDSAQTVAEAQKGQMLNAARPVSTEIEIPVNLNLTGLRGDGGVSAKAGKESVTSRAFEEALARELRSGLSNDIVRDATVILKNGGEGTVKLSLRPASLGDVKVRLEMTENKITGYIIVESSEALRAFERELPVLEKAFRDSGFSETNLEMSLAQDQQNFYAGSERQDENFQSLSPAIAASRYEQETEWIGDPPIEGGLVFSSSVGSMGRTPVNLLV